MTFPRYPKYKDSGVEWLGEVPANWAVAPLASRFRVQLGKMLDSSRVTGDHLRPYLRVFDVQWGCINTSDLPTMDFDEGDRLRFALVAGDILVNEGGSYPGRSAIWQGELAECYYQKALHRMRAIDSTESSPRFMCYVMEWAAQRGVFVAGGNEATIEHLPAEKLRRYRFAFPPMREQVAIAAFLGTEVAKIDALVAEQQRLVELLKEKRQAVISHAVTKGLNPDAPMKPSGILWLGEVPEHWEVRRLTSVCGFKSGKAHEPFIDDDGQFICVNARFVSTGGSSRKMCTRNLSPVHRNDILMVMSDLPNGRALARAFMVVDDLPYAVNQRVCIMTPSNVHPRFLYYQVDRAQQLLAFDDGVSQTHLPNSAFTKLLLKVPPSREQADIAVYLDSVTADIDTLTAEAERAITLLQERRTALISAAVTGQIDVRGLRPGVAAS